MARLRDAAPMGVARQYTYINRSKMEEEIVRFTKVATPLGDMRAYCSPKGICCLEFTSSAERLEQFHQRLQRYYGNPKVLPGECDAHASLQQWLCRYFDGDSSASQTLWICEAQCTSWPYGASYKRFILDILSRTVNWLVVVANQRLRALSQRLYDAIRSAS